MPKSVASARLSLVVALVGVIGVSPLARGAASQEDDALRQEALAILAARVGTWDSRWEFLGADGEITRRLEGTETTEPIEELDGQALRSVTHVPEIGLGSVNLMYYNPIDRKLYLFSLGKSGDHWIFTEEVGSGVMTTLPHRNADGTETIIRYRVMEASANRVHAFREDSTDGGVTWTPVLNQYLTRRPR